MDDKEMKLAIFCSLLLFEWLTHHKWLFVLVLVGIFVLSQRDSVLSNEGIWLLFLS